ITTFYYGRGTMAEEAGINHGKGQKGEKVAVESQESLASRPPPSFLVLVTIIGGLCLGTFLFGLDLNIIGVAIPPITTEFRSLADVAWYGSAYMLTLTAFQPLFGNLYKLFNNKMVYMASLLIFEVGSIVSATAPRSNALIAGRAVLGLGAAGLLQGALAIIGLVVAVDKVPLYIGIVVSSMGFSTCAGPVIGGAITEHIGWRWCFWIKPKPNYQFSSFTFSSLYILASRAKRLHRNVPAGAVVLLIIFFFVDVSGSTTNQASRDLPIRDKIRHMDLLGLAIFLGAVCCLLLVLTWGGQAYPWGDGRIIGLFVAFGVLTASLIFWLIKQGELALIPLRVLKNRSIYMGSITLVGYGVLSVVYGYYLPILFQSIQGVSTTESGVRFIALIGPQIFAIVVTGALVSQWGYYAYTLPQVPYAIAGGVICCIGSGFLTTVHLNTPTVEWAAYLVITGLGLGIAAQIPYTSLQAVLEYVQSTQSSHEEYIDKLITRSDQKISPLAMVQLRLFTIFCLTRELTLTTAIAVFSFHLAGAIGTAIGQTLLISGLNKAVPKYTDGAMSAAAVIQAGATGLAAVAAGDMQLLESLRMAYGEAVRRTIILGLAGACLAVPAATGMKWLNIKRVAEERKDHATNSTVDSTDM
ncbi:MFS general substrate transporter, partial [Apiospora rasikravindrae]